MVATRAAHVDQRQPGRSAGNFITWTLGGKLLKARGTTRLANPSKTTQTVTPRSAAATSASLNRWPSSSPFQMKVAR